MTESNDKLLPVGCVTSKHLLALSEGLIKLHAWHKKHGGKGLDEPCLRLLQGSRNGKVTALVESGGIMLKMAYKDDRWIVLGDALSTLD